MKQNSLFGVEPEGKLRPLRPRQAACIPMIRDAVKAGHKRIVVQAPTGFGKTLLSAHILSGAVAKGNRAMFTCPAINLVNQTLKAFEAEGIHRIGVIQAKHERTDWLQPVQIASVQTLIRRAVPEVDFVIIDECHNQWDKLNEILDSEEWKDKIVIGLSATPWAKGMGLRWTKLIVAARTQQLIDEGHLVPFRIYAPQQEADLSKVKITAGDYNEHQLSEAMDKPVLVADIVKTWQERAAGLPTFLFAVECKHAQSLQKEFHDAGISCGYIDAYSDDDDRRNTFRRFREGSDKIIASVGCLVTGVDEDVRCIVDAAPTKSEIKHVQKIGRGLRTAPEKRELLILDHAGNTLRLGMVTDIHHDTMNCQKKTDKSAESKDKPAPKPKKCAKCGMVMAKGERICPGCKAEQLMLSGVTVEDGELVEWGSKSTKPKATMATKQEFYSGLLHIARSRGHQDGWAAHAYREKFGVWPNQLDKVSAPPSREVQNFETGRRIRRAKTEHPTQGQIDQCKREGIVIPAGSTKLQVSKLMEANRKTA
ncbi:MAG TPA: DEAD/DEAH box helicase family protein [Candidatus Sulfotelmatobacter sp.]|jgi:superfamily II DNA or RNA helicase